MNDLSFSGHTQRYWTCKALVEGRVINTQDEIGEVKGWRLCAITHVLRTEYAWPIQKEERGPRRVAYFWLPEGCDWRRLRFPLSAEKIKGEMPLDHTRVVRCTGENSKASGNSKHG